MCGINGDQPNEFSGVSKYSKYTYVVFARGTEDLPKGDCLKCEFSFKVGGWLAEFGSKDKFRAAREKEPAVQSAFMQCSSVWLQHHNAGKRCRNQSSSTRAKLGSNILDTMMDIRQNRKRIVKKKARRLKVKIRGKIFTPERYRARYKRTIEKAGLTAKYYTIHGKKVWGVLVRTAPDGEYDVSDEEEEGIEEHEELDDGEECLRADQQQVKFDQVATDIGDAFRDAVFMAEAMANPGGHKDGTDDEDSDKGATEEEEDDDSSHTDDDSDSDGDSCTPGLVGKVREAIWQGGGGGGSAVKPRRGAAGGAAVTRALVEVSTLPKRTVGGAGGSSHGGDGGGGGGAGRRKPTAPSPGETDPLGSEDELSAVNFAGMAGTFQAALDAMDQPAMAQLSLTTSQMSDVVTLATAGFESLQKLCLEVGRAEHSLRRRKVVNRSALEKLSTFKSSVNALAKILGSIKGVRTEWSAVLVAWSNLPSDISETLRKLPALVGYIVKKDAVEQVKFNQFNLLQPLLSVTQNAQGLHQIADRDDHLQMNTQILESVMAKIVPAAGRNIRPPDSLVVILREVVGTFVGMDPAVLPSEPLADMQSLQKALKSIELDTDITEIQETIAALEKLSPSDVAQSSILYPQREHILLQGCGEVVLGHGIFLSQEGHQEPHHPPRQGCAGPGGPPEHAGRLHLMSQVQEGLGQRDFLREQLEEQEDSAGARELQ